MTKADGFRSLAPDNFEVGKLVAIEFGAGDGGPLEHGVGTVAAAETRVWIDLRVGGLLFGGFGVGKVDEFIFGEVRINDDVVQAALPFERDLRRSADRLIGEFAVGEDAQATRLFSDQKFTVGQISHRPWELELRERLDIHGAGFSFENLRGWKRSAG